MSADMTATTMATYLPEVWSKKATVTYRSNVVLPDLMDRSWEPEIGVGRGDTVNIPNFTQNTTAVKRSTFGTGAALTFDAVTEAQTIAAGMWAQFMSLPISEDDKRAAAQAMQRLLPQTPASRAPGNSGSGGSGGSPIGGGSFIDPTFASDIGIPTRTP